MQCDPSRDADRLSGIQTSWSLVRQAHDVSDPGAVALRRELLERYTEPARRYLCALLRDTEAAQEVLHEFAVRFLRGDLHRVDPRLGRFRNYVKTVLINLVRARVKSKSLKEVPLTREPADRHGPDELFDAPWREQLLTHAWREFEELEQFRGRPYCTLLKYKSQQPEASSDELATMLAQHIDSRKCSAAAARKMLQRARREFARLLVRLVRDTLANPTREELLEELRLLGLAVYCEAELD